MRIIRNADPGPFSDHRAYKPHLQPLFRHRCAYCLSHEDLMGRFDAMEVDHFRPKKGRPEFANLRLAWTNLYYCCRRCNQHKSNWWPNADELEQGLRFVDPCEEDSDEHFRLTRDANGNEDGRISSETSAARYSIAKIRLNRRQLIDIRRDIARAERGVRDDLDRIDRISSCLPTAPEESVQCSDMSAARHELREQRESALKRLEEIQASRPFPLAKRTE